MTQAIFADRGHGGIKGEQKSKQMFWNTSKNKLTMINVATLHTLPLHTYGNHGYFASDIKKKKISIS